MFLVISLFRYLSLPVANFYGHCLVGRGHHKIKISDCVCVFSPQLHLIGLIWDCYIIKEVIEVDELDEGKQDK